MNETVIVTEAAPALPYSYARRQGVLLTEATQAR